MERLGLIKKLKNSEKEEVQDVLREKDIPEYAFIKEAYMGLPLPLFIRVHRFIEFYYLSVIEISLIFAIVAAYFFFPSIFAINHLKLVIVVIGVIVSIVSIITFFVLWRIRRRMKYEARVFKDMREPKEKKRRIEEED